MLSCIIYVNLKYNILVSNKKTKAPLLKIKKKSSFLSVTYKQNVKPNENLKREICKIRLYKV